MKPKKILIYTILFVGLFTLSSCQIVIHKDQLKTQILEELGINPPPPPQKIALLSHHGRYVTALGEKDSWAIRQVPGLNGCDVLTLEYHWNGKISFKTCYDKYITAPESGAKRQDWILEQEVDRDKCGQFDMYELGGDRVAFKTCAGRFITAGDNGLEWQGELEWALVGETEILDNWEFFTIEKK